MPSQHSAPQGGPKKGNAVATALRVVGQILFVRPYASFRNAFSRNGHPPALLEQQQQASSHEPIQQKPRPQTKPEQAFTQLLYSTDLPTALAVLLENLPERTRYTHLLTLLDIASNMETAGSSKKQPTFQNLKQLLIVKLMKLLTSGTILQHLSDTALTKLESFATAAKLSKDYSEQELMVARQLLLKIGSERSNRKTLEAAKEATGAQRQVLTRDHYTGISNTPKTPQELLDRLISLAKDNTGLSLERVIKTCDPILLQAVLPMAQEKFDANDDDRLLYRIVINVITPHLKTIQKSAANSSTAE